ncbi:MAG: glycosyltransferase [Blastocatellia bacterium]|nr:glycosyltransferase [Blastocatellia bacterium]
MNRQHTIFHLSTDDIDGGAARAAFRLHRAVNGLGLDEGVRSRMLVKRKKTDDDDVTVIPWVPGSPWKARFDRVRKRISWLKPDEAQAGYTFNFNAPPEIDQEALAMHAATPGAVLYLHWMNGFLDVQGLRRLWERSRPMVFWVIHDLEPFTGGCHYAFGCDGYTRQCGGCPQLHAPLEEDLSRRTWNRKRELLAEMPIRFIAPTGWGEARVRESALFRNHPVHRIPLPMDIETFRPMEKKIARQVLRLPEEKPILLFGATYLEDRRKGTEHLIEALHRLSATIRPEDLQLLIVGLNGKSLMRQLPFPARYLGPVGDELLMALAYQAADLFVCPSIEDSGPMMVSEAMLCETPVVAFDAGAAADLITPMVNGYLAPLGDAPELANGIMALLKVESPVALRRNARETAAAHHAPPTVARRHAELIRDSFGVPPSGGGSVTDRLTAELQTISETSFMSRGDARKE